MLFQELLHVQWPPPNSNIFPADSFELCGIKSVVGDLQDISKQANWNYAGLTLFCVGKKSFGMGTHAQTAPRSTQGP